MGCVYYFFMKSTPCLSLSLRLSCLNIPLFLLLLLLSFHLWLFPNFNIVFLVAGV